MAVSGDKSEWLRCWIAAMITSRHYRSSHFTQSPPFKQRHNSKGRCGWLVFQQYQKSAVVHFSVELLRLLAETTPLPCSWSRCLQIIQVQGILTPSNVRLIDIPSCLFGQSPRYPTRCRELDQHNFHACPKRFQLFRIIEINMRAFHNDISMHHLSSARR